MELILPATLRRNAAGAAGKRLGEQKTNDQRNTMKRAAVISIIAVALGLSSVAAESTASARANGKVAAAMSQAAQANQYLFVFFYEKDDDATKGARKIFDATVKKITPAAASLAVERGAPAEQELVTKYGVGRAPMPLAISPSGAVTGACEVVKTGVFAPLLQAGRLCSGQDIGRLIGA